MKIINLVWESFNRYDVTNLSLPGFGRFNFNSCAGNSATALYLMQTGDIDPEFGKTIEDLKNYRPAINFTKKFFSKPNSFIANFAKTRIISIYWPHFYDTNFLDPRTKGGHEFNKPHGEPEPAGEQFENLLDFLKNEFYQSDYQHLIYWSMVGHGSCGNCRIGEENKGVAATLEKTATHWMDCIKTHVMPLVNLDKSILMMHNDHGTTRNPIIDGRNNYNDGFIYLPSDRAIIESDYTVTLSDIRKTLRMSFGIDDKLPPEIGKCLVSLL